MKKTLKIFSLLLLVLTGVAFTACSDDENNEYVPGNELPAAARTFLSSYYPSETIVYSERETDDGEVQYKVTLSSGDKVIFDEAGVWADVEAPDGRSIPDGIALKPIADYVANHYDEAGIQEISRTPIGFEVELTTGMELRFSPSGEFYGEGI